MIFALCFWRIRLYLSEVFAHIIHCFDEKDELRLHIVYIGVVYPNVRFMFFKC